MQLFSCNDACHFFLQAIWKGTFKNDKLHVLSLKLNRRLLQHSEYSKLLLGFLIYSGWYS